MCIFGIVGKTESRNLSCNLCLTQWAVVTHQGIERNEVHIASLPDSEQTFFLEKCYIEFQSAFPCLVLLKLLHVIQGFK